MRKTHPSFYVNPRKNLFYCHGCGRGGDLIRFVELSQHLSFRQMFRLQLEDDKARRKLRRLTQRLLIIHHELDHLTSPEK